MSEKAFSRARIGFYITVILFLLTISTYSFKTYRYVIESETRDFTTVELRVEAERRLKEYPNKITTDSIRKHIKDFEIHQKMITKDSIFVTEVEYKKRQDSTDYEQLKRYSQLYRILSVNTEALSRIEARQLNQ